MTEYTIEFIIDNGLPYSEQTPTETYTFEGSLDQVVTYANKAAQAISNRELAEVKVVVRQALGYRMHVMVQYYQPLSLGLYLRRLRESEYNKAI